MGEQDHGDLAQFAGRLANIESDRDIRRLYPKSIWGPTPGQQRQEAAVTAELAKYKNVGNLVVRDFAIYNAISAARHPGIFTSPSFVAMECKHPSKAFLMDGHIVNPVTGQRNYVTGMKIYDVSIGGFDHTSPTTTDSLLIQTVVSKSHKLWYRLIDPAPEYRTIWVDFIWLSDFAKLVLDHLRQQHHQTHLVTLTTFRTQFLAARFAQGPPDHRFQAWYNQTGQCQDFGKHLVRHGKFLKTLAPLVVADGGNLLGHPIWSDIMPPKTHTRRDVEQTVVTTYVARSFLHTFPTWGAASEGGVHDLLQTKAVDHRLAAKRENRRTDMGFAISLDGIADSMQLDKILQVDQLCTAFGSTYPTAHLTPRDLIHKVIVVRPRHAVSAREASHSQSKLAIVTSLSGNRRMLRVRWLVTPVDAIQEMCGGTSRKTSRQNNPGPHYPSPNELYISDDCSCYTVSPSDVQASYSASLLIEDKSKAIFILKRFSAQDQAIVDATAGELERICHDPLCIRSSTTSEVRSTVLKPQNQVPIIENISMFSGCGLFDAGIEDEGCIHTTHSFDYNIDAVASIRANRTTAAGHEVHHTGVNEWMKALLDDKQTFTADAFAKKAIMLAAGCSCCGWSLINSVRGTKESQRQCSFLASVISAIEIILPQFVAIENVPAMAGPSLGAAQAVAVLCALGYQARIFKLKAHQHGGSTKRERLFILAAAPGLELPEEPTPSHGDDLDNRCVTIREAITHLPAVDNDTWINVIHPDHMPLQRWNAVINEPAPTKQISLRAVGQRIPKLPRGVNLAHSRYLLTPQQQLWYDNLRKELTLKTAATLRRMQPDQQFDTVLTKVHSLDARGGATVHYEQDRTITLEETRTAQGIPRSWVLVGLLNEQQRQVGNAVPFALGAAIGRVIGDAWRRSQVVAEVEAEAEAEATAATEERQGSDAGGDDDSDIIYLGTRSVPSAHQ